jgi:DNA-binding MarR family transcriptional regulator
MSRTRSELVDAIAAQGRANSTVTVLFHAAIAERLGLNPSDHKCADLMMSQSEPCTPGRLAELTGLSTGAITGVIDRLERAGFLEREHDPQDRRRVLLRLTQTRAPEMHALFAPLGKRMRAICEDFTIAELAVVLRFMREVNAVTEDIAAQLRSGQFGPGASRDAAEDGVEELVDVGAGAIARAVRGAVSEKLAKTFAKRAQAAKEKSSREVVKARAKAFAEDQRARAEAFAEEQRVRAQVFAQEARARAQEFAKDSRNRAKAWVDELHEDESTRRR